MRQSSHTQTPMLFSRSFSLQLYLQHTSILLLSYSCHQKSRMRKRTETQTTALTSQLTTSSELFERLLHLVYSILAYFINVVVTMIDINKHLTSLSELIILILCRIFLLPTYSLTIILHYSLNSTQQMLVQARLAG